MIVVSWTLLEGSHWREEPLEWGSHLAWVERRAVAMPVVTANIPNVLRTSASAFLVKSQAVCENRSRTQAGFRRSEQACTVL